MNHHAYFFAGNSEEGIEAALMYAKGTLGLTGTNNPDISVQSFGLFSVEDARKVFHWAYRSPAVGSQKILIIVTSRLFEQAQNALLKIFEEPPAGVTLVLVIPSEGILLPTLRSRLLLLPSSDLVGGGMRSEAGHNNNLREDPLVQQFITLDSKERAKIVTKLVEQSKSDSDDTKQEARASAIRLVEGLITHFYTVRNNTMKDSERQKITEFLMDLDRFMPLMHTRSAPLKLIFEHVMLVFPVVV